MGVDWGEEDAEGGTATMGGQDWAAGPHGKVKALAADLWCTPIACIGDKEPQRALVLLQPLLFTCCWSFNASCIE